MNTIKVGQKVMWRDAWGTRPAQEATIEGIDLCEAEGEKYGIEVQEAFVEDKDRCCFSLTNGKWAYGYQIDLIEQEVTNDNS